MNFEVTNTENKSSLYSDALAMEGYRKTQLGWIPEEWGYEKIGPYIDLLSGHAFSSNKYSNEGIKLLRGANIKRGYIDWNNEITVRWNTNLDEYERYRLQEKDLVIAMDGSLVGRSFAQISKSDLPAFLLQRVARIRTKKINVDFLKFIVGSRIFVNYCDSVKTVTAIPHISSKDLKKFKIPLPSLPEQRKIGDILSTWDEAISKIERLITKKKELKRGLMQQLLTSNESKDWKEKKLGELGTFSKGKGISKSEDQDSGIPAIRYGELYTDHHIVIKNFKTFINQESASQSKKIKLGDILFAGSGETAEEIGKCAVFIDDCEAYAGGDIVIFRSAKINPVYLSYYLNSSDGTRQKSRLAQGHSVVHIYSKDLKQLQVLYPSSDRQNKIVQIFSTLEKEKEILIEEKDVIEEQKKGLMQQLLMGKTRVKIFNTNKISKGKENG